MKTLQFLPAAALAFVLTVPTLLPAQILEAFNPTITSSAWCGILDADGGAMLGGSLRLVNNQPVNRLARLLPDGFLDPNFDHGTIENANWYEQVMSVGLWCDGSVLAGGDFTSIGPNLRRFLARVDRFGHLDTNYAALPDGNVSAVLVLPDARALLRGNFNNVDGQPCRQLARLNQDGSFDPNFRVAINGSVNGIGIQPDGRIVLGGYFTSVNGQAQTNLARLNDDGSLDHSFNPDPALVVSCLAVEADGSILVAGPFRSVSGVQVTNLARIFPNGALDAGFTPCPNDLVRSIIVQADGQILLSGYFTNIAGLPRKGVARLNPDGTADPTLDLQASAAVDGISLDEHGRALLRGSFTNLLGQSRYHLAVVQLPGTTNSNFEINEGALVWERTGVLPQVTAPRFEIWTENEGWRYLGSPVMDAGKWRLSQITNTAGVFRAVGLITADLYGNCSRLAQAVTVSGDVAPVVTDQPAAAIVNHGEEARFFASAFGSLPVMCEWRKNGVPITSSVLLSGQTTPPLVLTNVSASDAGEYSLFVSNAWGTNTSRTASLTIRDPFIATNPRSLTLQAGGTALFSPVIGGSSPLLCQWYKNGLPITNSAFVTGVETSTLTISNVLKADEGSYSLQVSNTSGLIISGAAQLNVLDPAILSQPTGVTLYPDDQAVFQVVAAGTPPLTYGWQKNGVAIAGSDSPELVIPNVRVADAGKYTVRITNSFGVLTSSVAPLVVVAPRPEQLTILSNPASQYVLKGTNVQLSVMATGAPPLYCRWYFITNLDAIAIPRATNWSVTISNATFSRTVFAVVSNAFGSLNTKPARIEVKTNLTILGLPARPLSAIGWNKDVIIENSDRPTYTESFGSDYYWKEEGFLDADPTPHNFAGLPHDGRIVSLADTNVVFQLQPYTNNNALLFTSSVPRQLEIALTPPVRLAALSLLAAIASQPPPTTLTLVFTDGSTNNVPLSIHDWWNCNTDAAATRRPATPPLGRVKKSGSTTLAPDQAGIDLGGFTLDHLDIDYRTSLRADAQAHCLQTSRPASWLWTEVLAPRSRRFARFGKNTEMGERNLPMKMQVPGSRIPPTKGCRSEERPGVLPRLPAVILCHTLSHFVNICHEVLKPHDEPMA